MLDIVIAVGGLVGALIALAAGLIILGLAVGCALAIVCAGIGIGQRLHRWLGGRDPNRLRDGALDRIRTQARQTW